jgi:hypothetical protein
MDVAAAACWSCGRGGPARRRSRWLAPLIAVVVVLAIGGFIFAGFVHFVTGASVDGVRLCSKAQWSLGGTFVDLDSYQADPTIDPVRRLNITIGLIRCGVLDESGRRPAPPEPCDVMARAVTTRAGAGAPDGPALEALRLAILRRCVEDRWAPEVISCFEGARDQEASAACNRKLPTEQGDRLLREAADAVANTAR